MATKLAQAAADEVEAALPVGFDPMSIIAIISALIGIFKNCMQPPSPAAARQHVQEAYHNGGYDHGTMRVAKHQAKRAARKNKTRISDEEATIIATKTLDQIRTSSDADLKEAMDDVSSAEDPSGSPSNDAPGT